MQGMTLAITMTLLLSMFFPLHLWLMAKATTTIEFCEKQYRSTGPGAQISYDRGPYENVKAVLGPHFLLWLLPISPPAGSGLYFECSGRTPLVGAPKFKDHGWDASCCDAGGLGVLFRIPIETPMFQVSRGG